MATKSFAKKIFKRSSPIWSILLTVGITLVQVVGSRYIKEKKLKVTGSDLKTAFAGGVLGYFGLGSKKRV